MLFRMDGAKGVVLMVDDFILAQVDMILFLINKSLVVQYEFGDLIFRIVRRNSTAHRSSLTLLDS